MDGPRRLSVLAPPAYYADPMRERARCYLSHVFDPSASNTPSGSIISGTVPLPEVRDTDVDIHPKVRESMFYI
jgi:eukaryotic translation initiation factor 2C